MPKQKDFLAPLRDSLDGLGFSVEIGLGEDDRKQLSADSGRLQLKASYTGTDYVVMVAPSDDDDWLDLRDVLTYIEKGAVRYSEDPGRTYLSPVQYARAIERHHGRINEVVGDRVERQKLRNEIKAGVDEFVKDLHVRAAKRRSS